MQADSNSCARETIMGVASIHARRQIVHCCYRTLITELRYRGGNDPELSVAGQRRAEALAQMLKDADLTAIFVTEFSGLRKQLRRLPGQQTLVQQSLVGRILKL
jgi:hypothetical protein